MTVDTVFLSHLYSAGAIDTFVKETLNSKGTNHERVAAVLDHVRKDIRGRYDHFMKALKDSDQVHVVTLIEETSSKPRAKWMKNLADEQKKMTEKPPIFKDEKTCQEYEVNVPYLNSRLQLLDVSSYTDDDISTNDTTLEEILGDSKRNTVFQGKRGSGKTSNLVHILNTFRDKKKDQTEKPLYACMKDIKYLIYVKQQDCEESLLKTVESILQCRCPDHKDQAYSHFVNHPEETGILFDSLDEISKRKGLIKDILQEMKKNKRVIIAGCCSHDPVLDQFLQAENVNHVRVIGFDKSTISTYVEKYFYQDDKGRLEVDEENTKIVKTFKKSLEADRCLQELLSNPLNLSLVCILIKARQCEPDKLRGITRVNLFSAIEKFDLDKDELRQGKDGETKKYHKYTFSVILNDTEFSTEKMQNLNINPRKLPFMTPRDVNIHEQKKGCEFLWPHKLFSEYIASKFVLDCEDEKKEELMLYLASKREHIIILKFVLELIKPEEEVLKRIIQYILALQPGFLGGNHFHSLFSSIFCETKVSEKIHKSVININDVSELVEQSQGILKSSTAQLRPCKGCWKIQNFISGNEGCSIIHNAQACVQTCQVKETRARVFTLTIAPLLLASGQNGKRFLVPVPDTDRCVCIRKKTEEEIVIAANRPTDLIKARAYHHCGMKRSTQVTMELDKLSEVFGYVEYFTTPEEWSSMLKDFKRTCPDLEGKGTLVFLSQGEALLQQLSRHLKDLRNHGVRNILLKVNEDNIKGKNVCIASATKQGWQVLYCAQYIYLTIHDGPSILRTFIQYTLPLTKVGSLNILSPSDTLLKTFPKQSQDLIKHGVKQIIMNVDEANIKKGRKSLESLTKQGWQIIYADEHVFISQQDWPQVLKDFTIFTPTLIGRGSIEFPSQSQPLIPILLNQVKDLMTHGVKQITVTCDTSQMEIFDAKNVTKEGWQVIKVDDKIYLLSPEDWPVLLKDLIRSTSSIKKSGTLHLLFHDENLLVALQDYLKHLMTLGVRQIIINEEKVTNLLGTESMGNIMTQGWQVLHDDQHIYLLSPKEWPHILIDFINFTPSLTGKGSLTFTSASTTLFQTLPIHLNGLISHGVKKIILKAEVNQSMVGTKDLREILKQGWKIIYGHGCVYMSLQDLPQILNDFIQFTKPLTSQGSLNITSPGETLLQILPKHLKALKNHGVREITFTAEMDAVKIGTFSATNFTHEGWQVIDADSRIVMLSPDAWPELLQDLVRNTTSIKETGTLYFLSHNEILLNDLHKHLMDLFELGVREIIMNVEGYNYYRDRSSIGDVTKYGWQILYNKERIHLLSPGYWPKLLKDLIQNMSSIKEAGCLYFLSSNEPLLRHLPNLLKDILSLGVNQIVVKIAKESLWLADETIRCIVKQDWQVIHGGEYIYLMAGKEWTPILTNLIKLKPPLTEQGSITFPSPSETLLHLLPDHLQELMTHGVNKLTMTVDENITQTEGPNMCNIAREGWQIIHADGKIHLLSPDDWPQLLQDLTRNSSSVKETGCLHLLSYNEGLHMKLPNILKDLMDNGVKQMVIKMQEESIMIGAKSMEGFSQQGWKVLQGGQCLYMSSQEWPLILENIAKITPPLTEEGTLNFHSPSETLLQTLPNYLQDLMDYGVKVITMRVERDTIQGGRFTMSTITDKGWQVIYGDGKLYLLSSDDWHLILQDLKRNQALFNESGTFYLFTPNDALIQSLPTYATDLMELGVKQMVIKIKEEAIRNGTEMMRVIAKQDWQSLHSDQYIYLMACQEWPLLLKHFIRFSLPNSGQGSITFPLSNELLLNTLPGQVRDLRKHGVKRIIIGVDEDLSIIREETMTNIANQGWHIVYHEKCIYMSLEEWPQSLQGFMKLTLPLMEKSSLIFPSPSETLLHLLPDHLQELMTHGVNKLTMTVDENITQTEGPNMCNIAREGWQIIHVDGKIHLLSPDDWPQLLEDLTKRSFSINKTGTLFFLSHNAALLGNLPNQLQKLKEHGMRQIIIKKEEDTIVVETGIKGDTDRHKWQIIHGDQYMYIMSSKVWPLIFKDFIKFTPSLTGQGSLHFPSGSETLLQTLTGHLMDLGSHGVLKIIIEMEEGTMMVGTQSMKYIASQGWKVIYDDHCIYMSPQDWPNILKGYIKFTSTLTADGFLTIPSPSQTLLQILPKYVKDLMTHGVKKIMMTVDKDIVKMEISSMSQITSKGWQVINSDDKIVLLSPDDWPQLLQTITRNSSSIKVTGRLNFLSYNAGLLKVLPNYLKDLMDNNVKEIVTDVEGDIIQNDRLSFTDIKNHGWQILYSEHKIFFLSSNYWLELLVELIKNNTLIKKSGTLFFLSDNEALWENLPSHLKNWKFCGVKQIIIKVQQDATLIATEIKRNIKKQDWLIILGDQYTYIISAQAWPLIFEDFIKFTPPLTGNGSLSFPSQGEMLLQTLPNHLKDLMAHGVKHIKFMAKEDDIKIGAINVTEVLKLQWRVIYANEWLHITSPEVDASVPEDEIVVAVKDTSRWVRARKRKTEYDVIKIEIYSNKSEDIITTQVLTMLTARKSSLLRLYINQCGGYYSNTQHIHTPQDWQHLLEEVVQHDKHYYLLDIHHGEHPSPTQEEVSCYDYNSLLEVLPGLISKLHDKGFNRIWSSEGRVRGRSIMRILGDVQKTWDVRESDYGMSLFRQGTETKVMILGLFRSVITVSSERERDQLFSQTDDLGLFLTTPNVVMQRKT